MTRNRPPAGQCYACDEPCVARAVVLDPLVVLCEKCTNLALVLVLAARQNARERHQELPA